MNRKMIYRIELKEIDTIFTDMVLMAANSNGGVYKPLHKIADAADWLCQKYETTGKCHTVNRIGEHMLTIDKGTTNVLTITEIEVMDIEQPQITSQEAKDILAQREEPTLNRYAGTGIDNPNFDENLN